MTAIGVAVSDFPGYDGSSSPEEFLRQCSRLATLGRITDDQLPVIVAARCRGRALAVVNGIEDCGEKLTLDSIKTQLFAHFGDAVEQATQNLSSLVKGALSAHDYGLKVKQLVRRACPEFFNEEGQVKKPCVPSYSAALYRHFLIGLTTDEKRLLSRLKATTFDQCLSELTREEGLCSAEASGDVAALRVRWRSLDSAERESARGRWSASPYRRGRWSSPVGGSPAGDRWRDARGERASRSTEWERRGRWSSPAAGAEGPAGRGRSASPRDGRLRAPTGRGWTPPRGGGPAARRGPPPATGDGDTDSSDGGPAPPGRARDGTRDRPPDRGAGTRGPGGRFERRRPGTVRCWSCGGVGHFKRQCPNEYAGRHTSWD